MFDTSSLIKGLSAAGLFVLAKGQNSSLSVPLIGEFSTPVAGFIHGWLNEQITRAAWPYVATGVHQIIPKDKMTYHGTRAAHIATSASSQYLLLYGTGDEETGLIVGAINDLVHL
jgi:hypothetical protein